MLRNLGDGVFATAVKYVVGDEPQAVALADLNRDGRLDLVVTNNRSGSLSLLFNEGGGAFAPAVSYPALDGPVGRPGSGGLRGGGGRLRR